MSAVDVRKGDKVRITKVVAEFHRGLVSQTYLYEGEVSGVSTVAPFGAFAGTVVISLATGETFSTNEPDLTVELLERAKPKVGDVVKGRDLGLLPYATLVKLIGATRPALIGNGRLSYPDGSGSTFPVNADYNFAILCLPE